jgi:hypothetical protein
MPTSQRSLLGHPGAAFFGTQFPQQLKIDFFTSSRPPSYPNVPALCRPRDALASEARVGVVGCFHFLAQHTFVRRMLTGPPDGGTLSGMPESLKAPAWFRKESCLLDGFFNEDRTAVVGRCNAHMSVPLLASGVIDKPFPQATVEIEKVGEATRKRLADEGFLPAEDSTVEPWLRFVLEPAPGEEVKSPDFQSRLADYVNLSMPSTISFSFDTALKVSLLCQAAPQAGTLGSLVCWCLWYLPSDQSRSSSSESHKVKVVHIGTKE